MSKHLVLAGGGHAHLTAILRIPEFVSRGHRVTVISPETHHYYSGMGPGMLSGMYTPQQVRFHIRRMVQERGGTYLEEKVERIFPERRSLALSNGTQIPYDVVSFNVGSHVPIQDSARMSPAILPVKPVYNLLTARRAVVDSLAAEPMHIVVVGGGPAGVEIAANALTLLERSGKRGRVTLVAGTRLLKDHPESVGRHAAASLLGRGGQLLQEVHMESFTPKSLLLTDGSSLSYDLVLMAVGVRPSPLFRHSGMKTDPSGGLMVNEHLQSVEHQEVFGGGDCICVGQSPLPRVGVHAVRQNPVLFHNLMASLEGGELKSFRANPAYLLVLNMGDGTGIAWKEGFVWRGRLAFLLKDFIDKRFMRRFQVSGELGEPV